MPSVRTRGTWLERQTPTGRFSDEPEHDRAPRLTWLLRESPALRRRAATGDVLFGTMETWLVWNLTGGVSGGVHVTDVTNASRTMLMDLQTLDWDDGLGDALPDMAPAQRQRERRGWRTALAQTLTSGELTPPATGPPAP